MRIATNYNKHKLLIALMLSFTALSCATHYIENTPRFNGENAYQDVEYQLSLGPRIPGSAASQLVGDWITLELNRSGWSTRTQNSQYRGRELRNIIGEYGDGDPWILLGTHYDTRLYADQDDMPGAMRTPVPGANDGGSGVALLLELARLIPEYWNSDYEGHQPKLWFVFFDGEDNGGIGDNEWAMGSRAFVESLTESPDRVVILDMVADSELLIYRERNSDQEIANEIWNTAFELGYANYFSQEMRFNLIDDHIPFIDHGIPAALVIDFDYQYWHTTEDTIDKISVDSFEIVGDTIFQWLLSYDD